MNTECDSAPRCGDVTLDYGDIGNGVAAERGIH